MADTKARTLDVNPKNVALLAGSTVTVSIPEPKKLSGGPLSCVVNGPGGPNSVPATVNGGLLQATVFFGRSGDYKVEVFDGDHAVGVRGFRIP